jgi:hypothetical protein
MRPWIGTAIDRGQCFRGSCLPVGGPGPQKQGGTPVGLPALGLNDVHRPCASRSENSRGLSALALGPLYLEKAIECRLWVEVARRSLLAAAAWHTGRSSGPLDFSPR